MTDAAEDAVKQAERKIREGVHSTATPGIPEIPEPATPQPTKFVQPKKD